LPIGVIFARARIFGLTLGDFSQKSGRRFAAASAQADATMRAMLRAMRPFFITLACTWLGITGAAIVYSDQHPPSHWIMWATLPAFLLEAVFYLGSIFKETRTWLSQFRPARMQAAFLWFSALAPYLLFSLSAGTFERNSFTCCRAYAVLAFWYALLPRRVAYDIGFLIVAAAPLVSRVFGRIYHSPDEHLDADILGHLMWIRLGIAVLLIMREWDPGAFGLWPRMREWRIGTLYYLIFIIPVVLLALGLHDVRFELRAGPWWQVAGSALEHFSEFYGRGAQRRIVFSRRD